MKTLSLNAMVLLIWISFIGISCNPGTGETEAIQVRVEMEKLTGSSSEIEIITTESGSQLALISGSGWISFDAPILVPGRYRTEVRLQSTPGETSTCWLEDYTDNKDDRQYNITGTMEFPGSGQKEDLVTMAKDGTPLNKGNHKMKLHIQGDGVAVDWINFTLLKEHQVTPHALSQQTKGDRWEVVWSDEFEEDGLPDTTIWTYDIGDWGWGNNELQYYTEGKPENARIENGNLIIEAHKIGLSEKWTSARLTTRGKTSFVHGRIEFRARVPKEKGNWAAGWTLGDAYIDELSWPYCGEIDIMESVGFELDDLSGDGTAHASVHCGAYYFKLNNHHTASTPARNMNEAFHLYAIEWTPEYIKAYVDDVHYFTYDDNSDSLTWPFDEPQNIILNLAMGGGWGGAQGMDEKVTSQKVVVDYVRVYEKR